MKDIVFDDFEGVVAACDTSAFSKSRLVDWMVKVDLVMTGIVQGMLRVISVLVPTVGT